MSASPRYAAEYTACQTACTEFSALMSQTHPLRTAGLASSKQLQPLLLASDVHRAWITDCTQPPAYALY